MKSAILLVSLGTPKTPDTKDVRAFLAQFLDDKRVVEVPRMVWKVILNVFILPFRPRSISKSYQALWDEYGDSPLRIIAKQQEEKLQCYFSPGDVIVKSVFTYGQPAIASTIKQLTNEGVEKFIVLPLYPQYSGSTTGAVYDQLAHLTLSSRNVADVYIIKSYYRSDYYLSALANSVRDFWQEKRRGDFLLMSYHGIPQSYIDKGDPYYQHCLYTSEKLAEKLGLSKDQWCMTFQSRFGKAQWLQPYTIEKMVQLGERKLKKLDIICPAFSADCVETLEEICVENAEEFIASGGGELRLIPCLNSRDDHIESFYQLSKAYLPCTNEE